MPDFIYRKENAISDSLCKSFIEKFELDTDRQQQGVSVKEGEWVQGEDAPKQSTDISFQPPDIEDELWGSVLQELIDTLETHRRNYMIHYDALQAVDPFEIHRIFNLQKYEPGQTYKEYHCERTGLDTSGRMAVWMIYLNDINDGGWTEFYYYNHFEEPKAGKLLIWPSDFTHFHRGLPAFTETKYILTGVYTFTPGEGGGVLPPLKHEKQVGEWAIYPIAGNLRDEEN